jgi:hypothetical protein
MRRVQASITLFSQMIRSDPVLGRAGDRGDDDFAAAVAAFGTEIDDPVGGLDDFEIVLDHDHRVALVDQFVQHFEQLGDVVEMQAGGRLVEDVERAAGGPPESSLASLTRCASPPDSVVACWPTLT